jgi:hypothetical protein
VRALVAGLGLLALASQATGADAPKPLAELDALRIGKLYAERQIFEQALLKLQAQQENLRLQAQSTRRDYEVKNAELQAAIAAAATASGVTAEDLKAGWQPAPEQRQWIKAPTP